MISRMYTFAFSIVLRGFLLGVIALFTVLFFLGYTPISTKDFLGNVFEEFGLSSIFSDSLFTVFFLFILFVVVFLYSLKKERLVMGIIGFLGYYSLVLGLFVVVLSLLVIVYRLSIGVYVDKSFMEYIRYAILGSVISLFSGLLTKRYPLVCIDLYVVSDGNKYRHVSIADTIELNGEEFIRVRIFGKPDVYINAYPEESIDRSDVVNTPYYYYIDVNPITSHPISLELFYKDVLIGKYKVVPRNICLKTLLFRIYYNDDKIYEQTYSVECRKRLLDASKQAIKAALAKIGLDITNVKDIQFYTEKNVLIPRETLISDLRENTILVRIYVEEKYLEVLKYYGRKDVLELWDTLIKRLEIIIENIPALEKIIDYSIERLSSKILFVGD